MADRRDLHSDAGGILSAITSAVGTNFASETSQLASFLCASPSNLMSNNHR